MKFKSAKCKFVSSKIIKGQIHGQGDSKRYSFIIVETNLGTYFSEIYVGTYNSKLIETCLNEINKRLYESGDLESLWEVKKVLHIPFISGNGVYEACVTGVINAILPYFYTPKNHPESKLIHYYSGGTVKSSIDDLKKELEYALYNSLGIYKIRLDYRDYSDCLKKIKFLNGIDIKYAVDFIINTNFSNDYQSGVLKLISQMNVEKVEWIEEPCVPSDVFNQKKYIQEIRDLGFKLAMGESFTSEFEMYALESSQLSDILQIDSTMNCELSRLINIANTSKLLIGFHNWGSVLATDQNKTTARSLSKQSYFEIPFYETLFDNEVLRILKEKSRFTLNDGEHNLILNLINDFSNSKSSDFSWV